MSSSLPVLKRVSYSSLANWRFCPWYFKLFEIEKLIEKEGNLYTNWGHLVHKCAQGILSGELTPRGGAEKLKRTWIRFCRFYKKKLAKSHPEVEKPILFAVTAYKALLGIKKSFHQEFGEYKVLDIETALEEKLDKWPQKYKGFIDIVLETKDSIVIADFKSCADTERFKEFMNETKEYQLLLYKHFYISKENPDKKIKTYFVPIERKVKSKSPIEFMQIDCSASKEEETLQWMHNALDAINRNNFVKNRMSCHAYSTDYEGDGTCIFYKTEWCT